jgi:hypothetical protein
MESILAAGRIETGTVSISRQGCSFRGLIEECVKRGREISPGNRIHMDLEGLRASIVLAAQSSKGLPQACYPGRIPRTILSEAGKIVEPSRCPLRTTALAWTSMLLQPYFRAHSASGIAGTGLGFNIVREIVERHCGTNHRREQNRRRGEIRRQHSVHQTRNQRTSSITGRKHDHRIVHR